MDIKKKGNTITIKKVLKRGETYKISKSGKSESIIFFKKPLVCKGFSSKTESNHHIPLLDFDNTDISVVKDDIKFLQLEEGLPPAYIFTTNQDNYHVIFLSKHSPREIMDLMKFTHIDSNFYDSPLRTRFKSWVLRIGKKGKRGRPKFVEICNYSKKAFGIKNYKISKAHYDLIHKLYSKIYKIKYNNFDKGKSIKLQEYQTR